MGLLDSYKGSVDPTAFRNSLPKGVAPPFPANAFITPTATPTPVSYSSGSGGTPSSGAMSPVTSSPQTPRAAGTPSSGGVAPPQMSQTPRTIGAPVPAQMGGVPVPQFTPDQQAHQSWINNPQSGQGGLNQYVGTQGGRWQAANQSGDTDLINRLTADSQRVGYTLPPIPPLQVTAAPSMGGGSSGGTPSISTPNLQSEAATQLEKQRAGIKRAVELKLTGLKNNFDYTNKLRQDERTLRNLQFKETNNPFAGQTGYLASQMLRGDAIDDAAMDSNYQAQTSEANRQLADFEALAPEQQQALYNSILRIEREFGLQEGQLTGNYNGSRTLAAQGQDAQFTGTYNGQKTLQAQNQAFTQGMAGQQFQYGQQRDRIEDAKWGIGQYGYGDPKSDAGVFFEQYKGAQTTQQKSALLQQEGARLSNEMNKLQLADYPEEQRLKVQQLKKQIDEIGKAPIQNQNDLRLKEISVEKAQLELDNLKTPQKKKATADDYVMNINRIAKYDDDKNIINIDQIEDAILLAPLSEHEQYRLYKMYGLKWDGSVPKPEGN